MEAPGAVEGTLTWGQLLLTRLERWQKEEMLDSELERLAADLDGRYQVPADSCPADVMREILYAPHADEPLPGGAGST